jgi:hypothetical protein
MLLMFLNFSVAAAFFVFEERRTVGTWKVGEVITVKRFKDDELPSIGIRYLPILFDIRI